MSVVFFTDRDLGTRFPEILRSAGLSVERHADHFPPDCPDERWLAEVGRRGWVALSHNRRIRYMSNERAAIVKARVALFIVIGKAPYPDLARSFVATRARIEAFLQQHTPPFIAKVYRPTPTELGRRPDAPGKIDLWYKG